MPFISDLILCWRRKRSGDCHSGALRNYQSPSCNLSQLRPSRRSLRLPLQLQFQTATHLRHGTLKKTFFALQKPSPTCENLVRLNCKVTGPEGCRDAIPQPEHQEESPDPTSDRNLVLSQPRLTLVHTASVSAVSTNLYHELIYCLIFCN